MIPVNKTAALVTGSEWKDNVEIEKEKPLLMWENPMPMITVPRNVNNLTGNTFGRLTVIGYLGYGKWQVKCKCGRYSKRRSKAVLNKNNSVDACERCRELAFVRREYEYRKTGKDKDVKDFY